MSRLGLPGSTVGPNPLNSNEGPRAHAGRFAVKLAWICCGAAVVPIYIVCAVLLFPTDRSSATAMPDPRSVARVHVPPAILQRASARSGGEAFVPEWREASRLADLLRVHTGIADQVVVVERAGAYASHVGRAQRLFADHAATGIAGPPSLRAESAETYPAAGAPSSQSIGQIKHIGADRGR